MEIYYRSKGVNNYVEAKLCGNDGDIESNAYVLKMLEGNDISGILKPVISKLDEYIFVRYNITSFSMLDKYFLRQKPDIEILVNILNCVCNAISEAEKYLLNPNDLVVSVNYMLWDMGRKELKLIYVPFYNTDIKGQLKAFIEYIMKIFDYSSADGTMKMHRIYDAVVSDWFDMETLKCELGGDTKSNKKVSINREFNADDFRTLSNKVEDNYEEPAYINPVEDKNEKNNSLHEVLIVINTMMAVALFFLYFMTGRKMYYLIGALTFLIILAVNVLIYVFRKEKEEAIDEDKAMEDFKIYANQITREYEEEHYSGEYSYRDNTDKEPTMLQSKKEYRLVPLNDGILEPIILNGDMQKITIGRGHKEVDYRLNKEQISRVHASITLNEDGIFIEDKNSTNGTYINSVKLEAFEQKSLSVGDIIKLANEEFFVS